MRSAPTFNYLAWGFVAAVAIGCSSAATTGEPTSDDLPQDTAPDETEDGGDGETPDFEPSFKDGGTSDTKKDGGKGPSINCIDPDDPGSAQNVAKELPPTDDCDNSFKTVNGVADGPVDIDYYRLVATDNGWSPSHPISCSLDTNFSNETANTELCVFVACQNNTENPVSGCNGGNSAESAGMKGCCLEGTGQVTPSFDCKGGTDDDSAVFFMRVRQVNTEQCLPYKFSYRF